MKVYLGIDGGGTKTAFCAIDDHQHSVFTWSGKGSSIDTYPLNHVKDVLFTGLDALPSSFDVVAVFAGLGGIISTSHREQITALLQSHPRVTTAHISADNDVRNALAGSLGSTEGIVLIVGTGSVAYGHHRGISWRSGGYSHLEGDPGSAYDLGLAALRHTARCLDGRMRSTRLSRQVLAVTGATEFAQLASVFNTYSRGDIAQLARIVTDLHESRAAHQILLQGARECARMVDSVVRHIDGAHLQVGLIGGAVLQSHPYQALISREILRVQPDVQLVMQPVMSPAQGAALVAYQGVTPR
jgi:N-acetylglucosamine kinase-like BadF-type ATPase